MKTYTLSEGYEITRIEQQGEKVQIAIEKEGIREKDFIFLSNYPNLQSGQYEVIKIQYLKGLYYADLVKLPEPSPLTNETI